MLALISWPQLLAAPWQMQVLAGLLNLMLLGVVALFAIARDGKQQNGKQQETA